MGKCEHNTEQTLVLQTQSYLKVPQQVQKSEQILKRKKKKPHRKKFRFFQQVSLFTVEGFTDSKSFSQSP